jgi:tetratricopeptide (TPR) repeat protein
MQSQYEAAKSLYEQALPIYREVGSKLGEANTLQSQGDVERMQSQYEAAKSLYEQALTIYRDIRDEFGESDCILVFGNLDRAEGKWLDAIRKYKEAMTFYKEKGLKSEHALALWQLGMASYGADNKKSAIDYLSEARNIYKSIKNPKAGKVQEVLEALINRTPFDAKTQFE